MQIRSYISNMQGYLKRNIEKVLLEDLKHFPAVALLGPRQCGKSTTALRLKSKIKNYIYLDFESIKDLRKIEDPELFFEANSDNLVCLDEIQRKPDLFPVLRSILDKNRKNGQVLVLGSASRDLIKQSSESLAGRISYLELSPFLLSEIGLNDKNKMKKLWLQGGFPDSYLVSNNKYSIKWRDNFIRTYLERDIPQLGFNISSNKLRRLWMMCAHTQGQVFNSSKMGESLSISYHTVRNYVEILEQTFLLRILPSYQTNLKKRLVKAPKVYIRDSGILHNLLEIDNYNNLLGHPVFGSSWEGFALENILSEFNDWCASYYRDASGNEIDLILEKAQKKIAIEFKATSSPKLKKGFWSSIKELNCDYVYIIALVDEKYKIEKNTLVTPLNIFISDYKKGVLKI